jgi:hypothetical protein
VEDARLLKNRHQRCQFGLRLSTCEARIRFSWLLLTAPEVALEAPLERALEAQVLAQVRLVPLEEHELLVELHQAARLDFSMPVATHRDSSASFSVALDYVQGRSRSGYA